MSKPLHAGRAAEAGVMSALWASQGLTSRSDIIECAQGFAATQGGADLPSQVRWDGYYLDRNMFKYHAACYGTHGTLEALRSVRMRENITPKQVRGVRLKVDAGLDKMCNVAAPGTGLAAKFSLRFNAALALSGADTSDILTYDDVITARPDMVDLRDRVQVDLAGADWPEDLTEVTVEMLDGRVFSTRHDTSVPPGDLPLQHQRLTVKFLALAKPALGVSRAEEIARTIDNLDQLCGVAPLLNLTHP
jgi:2-methylcitrate dehydratase PrpD